MMFLCFFSLNHWILSLWGIVCNNKKDMRNIHTFWAKQNMLNLNKLICQNLRIEGRNNWKQYLSPNLLQSQAQNWLIWVCFPATRSFSSHFFFFFGFCTLVNMLNRVLCLLLRFQTMCWCVHRALCPCFGRPPWTPQRCVAAQLCDGNLRIVCPLVVAPCFSLSLAPVGALYLSSSELPRSVTGSAPHHAPVCVSERLNESLRPHLKSAASQCDCAIKRKRRCGQPLAPEDSCTPLCRSENLECHKEAAMIQMLTTLCECGMRPRKLRKVPPLPPHGFPQERAKGRDVTAPPPVPGILKCGN